jgi:hypothetical protein
MSSITDFDFTAKLQVNRFFLLFLDQMSTHVETSDVSLVEFILTTVYFDPRNNKPFLWT